MVSDQIISKDILVSRIQEIDNAMLESRKQLDGLISNINVLEGQKRETLYWLSKSEQVKVDKAILEEVSPIVAEADPSFKSESNN